MPTPHGMRVVASKHTMVQPTRCLLLGVLAHRHLLCERQGVYAGQSGDTRVFMTFGELTVSDAPAK